MTRREIYRDRSVVCPKAEVRYFVFEVTSCDELAIRGYSN
jgi:hypothetical protein